MIWIAGKYSGDPLSDKGKTLVLASCECARLALPFAKSETVLICVETAERWTRGEATYAELLTARKNADAAAAATRKDTLKKCAEIVRKHYPLPPTK